jgi:hypothetical protein
MSRVSTDDYIPLQPNVLGLAQDGLFVERSTGRIHKSVSGVALPMYTQRVEVFEDFHGTLDLASSAGTPGVASGPWRIKDTSSSGAPLYRQLADTHGGVLELLHSNDSEVQVVTAYWGDEQTIGYNKNPVMISRIRIPSTPSAANFLVWGFGSAQNDTEDSVAINAWMRLEAASLAVKLETDDGTTDADDKTGFTMTANVWYETRVAVSTAGIVTFDYRSSATPSSMGAWIALAPQTFTIAAGTTNLQPYIQLRKSSGTTTDTAQFDYVHVSFDR